MSKHIVIVESPAKSKTIEKYLGKGYTVLASYGHVRDLVPKEGAVDTENDFAMKYQLIERNEKHLEKIAKAVKKAESLFLATDPDREGEAISWHVYEVLRERGLLDDKHVARVVFHEITKRAIQEAMANPRELSQEMVNAQQARRALDYLVGFNLSPLLWKKVRRGLSAGRVQSPALRLIVERELEIEAFEPREYWTLEAQVERDAEEFGARLSVFKGDKVEQFSFQDESQAGAAEQAIKDRASGNLLVSKIEKKQRRRNPAAPFTTSTMQQEAARKLGFSAQKTMMTAQKLYEGIDIGEGTTGLITYMRTDSVTLSQDALQDIRATILARYGKENLPDEIRTFKTKAKNAQEAHEAIRPTSAALLPEDLKGHLEKDQLRLYELIWKRAVACQMTHALFNTVGIDLAAGDQADSDIRFRATGSVLVEPGFMSVYQEGLDDKSGVDDQDRVLPDLKEGETLNLKDLISEQHFTEPPPRFSEASLVKTLEEFGIGRPSTYASIISTLRNREYVDLESRRFTPTDIGRIVNRFLTEHFAQYVDYEFTARMEDDLDAVSRGEREWIPLLKEFWKPFHKQVEEKESLTREEVAQARILGNDPKSGRPMSVRMGRYGPFIQIGTKDDEDKPKFAGLRPGQKMDSVTMEDALELFKLPRKLGETPEGEPVSANIGRFGPYVRYADKYVSMGEEDPYTINLERALELVAEKKIVDANRLIQNFEEQGIQVLNGRYGPYATDGKKNARIPKDTDPKSLTLEDCIKLIEEAPVRGRRGKKKAKKKTATTADAPAMKQAAATKKSKTKRKTKKKAKAKKKTKKKAKKKTGKKAASKKTTE
jgi:DNA topoisomerase-1